MVLEMNGTIEAKSILGEEYVFTLDLPFKISPQSEEFVTDHNEEEFNLIGEGKKNLIADDNNLCWKHTEKIN